ncbi:hypothetical protein IKF67_00190 [Candidatus Saccharibacteria bacterium]|nr:hypothetical protein [Candidatus Saccharibacteria bacterium]
MKKNLLVVFLIGFFAGLFIGLVCPNENRIVAHAAGLAAGPAEETNSRIRDGITAARPTHYVADESEIIPVPSEAEVLFQEHLDILALGRIERDRYSLNPYQIFYTLENLEFSSLEEFCNYVGVTYTDVIASAQTLYGEADSVPQISHKAMVVWNLLNRLDTGYGGWSLYAVCTAPGQYAGYNPGYPVTDQNLSIVIDVIWRWHLEHNGVEDVGRVLPSYYMYFCAYGPGGMDNKFYYVQNGERYYLYPDQCSSVPYAS